MDKIDRFDGEYRWLSNFWEHDLDFDFMEAPVRFKSVEHAFQAMKATNDKDFDFVRSAPTPGQAKKRGRMIKINPNWDNIKLDIMEGCIICKFEDPTLKAKLLATGDAELIEGNTWGDEFWGVTNGGVGQNHLGKILMKVRSELRNI